METQTAVHAPAFTPNRPLPGELRNRERMAKVRIDCNVLGQATSNSLLTLGINEIYVYESEIKRLEALVEREPQKVQAAIEAHELSLEEYVGEGLADIPVDAIRKAEREKRAARYPGSPQQKFRDTYKRDIKPFKSLEVLERDLPSPEEEERISMETANARHITRAVAEVMTQMQQASKNTKS